MAQSEQGGNGQEVDIEALLNAFSDERPNGSYSSSRWGVKISDTKTGMIMVALDPDTQARLVDSLLARLVTTNPDPRFEVNEDRRDMLEVGLRGLLKRGLPYSETGVTRMAYWIANPGRFFYEMPLSAFISAIADFIGDGPPDEPLRTAVTAATQGLRDRGFEPALRDAADQLEKILHGGEPFVRIAPGEAWSDVALADLDAMPTGRRRAWTELLALCQATGGKLTAKWQKKVTPLIETVGRDEFKRYLLRWLPLVDRPRTAPVPSEHEWGGDVPIIAMHVTLLRALVWCAGFEADRDLARVLTAFALGAYQKRLLGLGNAAVTALGIMPGMGAIGQLALLKVKVKLRPGQKEIEKALNAAAAREKLPREEVDELAVPSYGMEEVGRRREVFGDYAVEMVANAGDVELRWSKAADGKLLKSAPAAAKKEHGAEWKELQAAAKDAGKMLAAQRERIDGLFLSRKRWTLDAWRERYLDHPLVGVIARRLLWRFETGGTAVDGAWLDGRLVGVDDRPVEGLGETTAVELWHPIGRPVDEVTAWRDWLDRHRVRQPFKQAHREVYVLTDAERATRVYSNRFAAHVVRQHQYHALCAARGWRNRLRLMVDDSYPPTSKDLPEWGLRAEFWVEGIGDNYGHDTTESGSFLHLATDQVRFYEIGAAQRYAHASGGGYSPGWGQGDAEPVPLDRVPPLVLSEILRDVDLFVGVASVGNDPTWSDGGPGGRHVDYWNHYSFGDLSANGQTRKAVLERLIPRLKIAPRCSFTDKFLVVRGDLRTYKIHLGSGNILMEPNDQYLCIVPKRGAAESAPGDGVFLPFEGDNTLSIVLSKALLLADDRKITDPTIVSQIKR